MSYFSNLRGILGNILQFGKGGPNLKAEAGALSARNAADSDYAAIRAALAQVYGNDIELNAGAAGAGSDWKLTVRRGDGQTEHLVLKLPATTPTPGQVVAVDTVAAGVVTLYYMNVAGGDDAIKLDVTDLAFGDASPKAMFTAPAGSEITDMEVVVLTSFDGAPSLSIGVTGTPSKLMGTGDIDLTAAAGTVYHVKLGLPAEGSPQDLIATYVQGAATVGAARIRTRYAPDPA